jgi:uncharacterized membrane protein YcaP (DUF421 family)
MLITLWRTMILFIAVTCSLMGKRQIGELQPSELVTTIMVSNIAAIPIENPGSPMINGLLSIALLACLEVLFSALLLKSKKLRGIIIGHPRCVIRDGTVDQRELRSLDDLMEMLRSSGTFDISEVLFAIVETNGSLSIYPKFSNRPVTNGDLSMLDIEPPASEAPPVIVVADGELDRNALGYCNLSERWLKELLTERKLKRKIDEKKQAHGLRQG